MRLIPLDKVASCSAPFPNIDSAARYLSRILDLIATHLVVGNSGAVCRINTAAIHKIDPSDPVVFHAIANNFDVVSAIDAKTAQLAVVIAVGDTDLIARHKIVGDQPASVVGNAKAIEVAREAGQCIADDRVVGQHAADAAQPAGTAVTDCDMVGVEHRIDRIDRIAEIVDIVERLDTYAVLFAGCGSCGTGSACVLDDDMLQGRATKVVETAVEAGIPSAVFKHNVGPVTGLSSDMPGGEGDRLFCRPAGDQRAFDQQQIGPLKFHSDPGLDSQPRSCTDEHVAVYQIG